MKVGIIGAGLIARKMAYTLNQMKEAQAYAIGSRSIEKARAFAQEFAMEKAYGSYEELVQDPQVKLIYIATPHSFHYDHIKLALTHDKAVLCEKAFTANKRQAQEVIELAHERKLLLAEAIWTRYVPMRKILDDVITSGIIGKVHSLTANLGYVIDHVPRLFDPYLAGGALLDVGVYPINFALMVLGHQIERYDSSVTFTETGVDAQNSMTFTYKNGSIAMLHSTQLASTDRRGMIFGNKGYIEVQNINNPQMIRVFDTNYKLIKEIEQPPQITGFEYQVQACIEAIHSKAIECPQQPHAEILRVMTIMDQFRAQWGLRYPFE